MSSPAPAQAPQKPWYRHGYVWLVIGLPLLSVVVSLSFVRTALTHKDDMVRDDWYMDGKTLEQDLSRDRAALDAGIHANISVQPDGLIDVQFRSNKPIEWPAMMWLNLYHPIHEQQDLKITLKQQDATGHYQGRSMDVVQLKGKYHAEVEDGGIWRLQQTVQLPIQQLTLHPVKVLR